MARTPKEYEQSYIDICLKALSENRIKTKDNDYESHHIQPTSCGGSNNEENLVLLTPKEHYIAHACLVKFLEDEELESMAYALNMIEVTRKHNSDKYTNETIYEENKKLISKIRAEKALKKKQK